MYFQVRLIRDIHVRPGLEMLHGRLNENCSGKNCFKISMANLAVAKRAENSHSASKILRIGVFFEVFCLKPLLVPDEF